MATLTEFVPATGEGSYVALRPPFMTEERWRWIWRQHKAELVEGGVAVMLGQRVFVHPQLFDAFLLQYGQRLAAQRIGL